MKYYIIAGEASGDVHGANLIRALKSADSSAEVLCWGGDNMQQACNGTNDKLSVHIRELAIMGFVEVLANLKKIKSNFDLVKTQLASFNPDVVILIDYPGFNLKVARYAHERGWKVHYYISPQVWAWKKGRIKAMRRDLDALYYIQPFERSFFASNAMPQAQYVGHPLIDEVERYKSLHSSAGSTDLTDGVVALLPGSRKQELKRTLPMMMKLASKHSERRFVIAAMSLIGHAYYETLIGKEGKLPSNVSLVFDNTYSILQHSSAAIVCSGTATLEAALFGVPQVVCYRANVISAEIARALLKIKYVSLVNLIADRAVVTELLQEKFTFENLEREYLKLTADNAYCSQIKKGYGEVVALLGGGGASKRVAELIVNTIETKK